jgi:hypothetical protein
MAQSTITMTARPIQGGEVWACSSGHSGNLKTKARHWRRAIANILEVIEYADRTRVAACRLFKT